MGKVELRDPFDGKILGFSIHPILYAIGLDALDLAAAPVHVALTALGGTGLVTEFGMDILVGILAARIFEDHMLLYTTIEAVLPSVLDLAPTYTLAVAYMEWFK